MRDKYGVGVGVGVRRYIRTDKTHIIKHALN
jgi:hypothetical protein